MEKNKFYKYAEQILDLIGGKENQTSVYNCMTRLRFKIVNKDLVKTDEIKKISIVKGTNWAGDELQVIIGGDCYKVREQCELILETNPTTNNKTNKKHSNSDFETTARKKEKWTKKILPAVSGIVVPTLPLLIGGGIIGGFQAILVLTGVLHNPAAGQSVLDLDLFSGIMYIASKVGLELIGISFLISTVKYLKGDLFLSIFLALGLTSRYMFGTGWELFEVFNQPIVVKTYEGTILPMVAAGFLMVFIDRWVKRWMPTQVDIVFRPALVFFSCLIIMLFTIGPVFRILEQFLAKFVLLIENLPIGLGTAIFALIWQPLVLTGTHVAVVTAVTLPMSEIPSVPSGMYPAVQIAIMGQIGASIGVLLLTKNQKTKQAVLGGIPGAIFGITEPLIYGINLPRLKPFLYGCLGGMVGGFLAGITDVEQVTRTGTGIMSWLGLGHPMSIAMGIVSGFVALAVSLALTMFLFKDRVSEYSKIKKLNNKISKKLADKNLYTELEKVSLKLKNNLILKEYENLLIEKQKREIQIEVRQEKIDDRISFIANKIDRINPKKEEKITKLNNKLESIEDLKIKKFSDELVEIEKNLVQKSKEYNELIEGIDIELKMLIKDNNEFTEKYEKNLYSLKEYYGV